MCALGGLWRGWGKRQSLPPSLPRAPFPPVGIGVGVGSGADVSRALAAGLAGYLPPRGEGMTLSPALSLCLAARHPGGAPAPSGVSFQVLGSSTWAGFGLSPPGLRSLQVAQRCLAACFWGFSRSVGYEAGKCKVLGCSASSPQRGRNFHLRNPAGVSRSLVSTVWQRRRYLGVNQGRNELRVPPGREQPSCDCTRKLRIRADAPSCPQRRPGWLPGSLAMVNAHWRLLVLIYGAAFQKCM